MDNPANILIGVFLGLTFGVPLLCLYMWGIFRLGQWAARRSNLQVPMSMGVAFVGLTWFPPSFAGFLVPVDDYLRGAICLLLFLLHAYPCSVGYATERQTRELADRKRYRKNVDDWLSEWECREMESLTNEDIEHLLQSNDDDRSS